MALTTVLNPFTGKLQFVSIEGTLDTLDDLPDGSIYGRVKLTDLRFGQLNDLVKYGAYESLSQTVYDDGDVVNNVYGVNRAGQSFIADKTGTLDSIKLRLTKETTGSITDLVIRVFNAGSDNYPTGAELGSVIVLKGTISGGASFVTANFTTTNITSGNRYAFTVEQSSDGGDSSNQYNIHGDNTVNSYTSGTAIYSLDGGSSWSVYTDDDAYFVITTTGTPGEEIVNLIENGTLKNNLDVDANITIDGRDISADGAEVDSNTSARHTQNTDTGASGDFTITGELTIKVYSQDAEPTLNTDSKMAVWIDTNDSNRVYLIFRRGSGDHVKIELV
ncbi:hypothetical protein LCGC14_0306350 [marine sediment metagenome]|uniref:Uncharacterized protein n=1 Tax=marine sediment metagenome TaxID=412755 RepID=A0A0F9WAS0_9ZZZZ